MTKGEDQVARFRKDVASLTSKAPSFDGSEEVFYWLRSMIRHFKRNDVTDERMKVEVLTGALKGAAKTWYSSLNDDDCDFDDFEDISNKLLKRFGKTEGQKLKEFSNLKPKSGESHSEYADRIKKTALGLVKSERELIEKYLLTIP